MARKEDSPIIEGESKSNVEFVRRKKRIFTKENLKEFLHWYFSFDVKDVWNWILLVVAALILWWAIRLILTSLGD